VTLNELNLVFDADMVVKIDVFKQDYPDSGLHLERRDDIWVVVNEYRSPAKQADIEKLIDDLQNVGGSVRAESADLYDEFEITDEKALQIEFYDPDGAGLLHLYVGKGGGTGRQSFVRIAGSPVTYLADINFISRFAAWNAPPEKKLPTDRWLELKLCDIERNDLMTFEIVRSKVTFQFANVEEPSEDSLTPPAMVWTQVSPEKGLRLEESKIRSLSSSVAGVRAKGVVDPANKDKFGLDEPSNIVRVSDGSEKEIEIRFSDAGGCRRVLSRRRLILR
jgi:hypothetical protein